MARKGGLAVIWEGRDEESSSRPSSPPPPAEIKGRRKLPRSHKEFEMMDVRVTIRELKGVVSERSKKLINRGRSTKKGADSTPPTKETTIRETIDGIESSLCDSNPTTAVASFFRNVSSSHNAIATHVPSLPLEMPNPSERTKQQHTVKWPTKTNTPKNSHVDLASFTFTRLFKKDVQYGREEESSFARETVEIAVGLSRGNEILHLGLAELILSGEELGENMIYLPVIESRRPKENALPLKKTKSKLVPRNRSEVSKKVKMHSFKSDKHEKFGIEKNTTLRVAVEITRHNPRACDESINQTVSGLTEYTSSFDDESDLLGESPDQIEDVGERRSNSSNRPRITVDTHNRKRPNRPSLMQQLCIHPDPPEETKELPVKPGPKMSISPSGGLVRVRLRLPLGIMFEPANRSWHCGATIYKISAKGSAHLCNELLPGDILLALDDVSVTTMDFDEIMETLVGKNVVSLLFRRYHRI